MFVGAGSSPTTVAPRRASGSASMPPPQPTSSAPSPSSGRASRGSRSNRRQASSRMYCRRSGFSRWSGRIGPFGSHQSRASRSKRATSSGSMVLEACIGASGSRRQRARDRVRLFLHDLEENARASLRLPPALLPVPHGGEGKAVRRRECLLREPERRADAPHVDAVGHVDAVARAIRRSVEISRGVVEPGDNLIERPLGHLRLRYLETIASTCRDSAERSVLLKSACSFLAKAASRKSGMSRPPKR